MGYTFDPRRKLARIRYYAHNILRDCAPQAIFRARLRRLVESVPEEEREAIADRLDYYNRLTDCFEPGADASRVGSIPMGSSMYYYDLKQYARYFPREWRIEHVFGDVTWVPPRPAIVKSRPIAGDNARSVLLNLVKIRHFSIVEDRIPFAAKRGAAVWRGAPNNPLRTALASRFHAHRRFDIGMTGRRAPAPWRKQPLSIREQLAFRYILSVEGHDVATNLKWIMASRSLCLMPAPRFETWFMEGRLRPGVHYVQLADDFSDLEAKVDHLERNPEEAQAIIAAANRHFRQFARQRLEDVISLLVLARYFVFSGREPDLPDWAAAMVRRQAAAGQDASLRG